YPLGSVRYNGVIFDIISTMSRNPKLEFKFWISGNNGSLMGKGKVRLLEAIQETGSIRKAATSLKMSYKKAWNQVNTMNLEAQTPVVIKTSGGAGGGGAVVTDEGMRLMKNYSKLSENCMRLIEEEFKKYNF
ncbi:MAG: winged helix-turn-helix domain-containing protein, partial [Bacteroidia bacterium]